MIMSGMAPEICPAAAPDLLDNLVSNHRMIYLRICGGGDTGEIAHHPCLSTQIAICTESRRAGALANAKRSDLWRFAAGQREGKYNHSAASPQYMIESRPNGREPGRSGIPGGALVTGRT